MLKYFLSLSIAVLLIHLKVSAQNPFSSYIAPSPDGVIRCYSEELAHQRFENDPDFRARINHFKNLKNNRFNSAMFADGIVRIPVIVHVVHNNGPENISDAQVQSQIRILNEDFRRIAGTNGGGPGADTEIEFFLAKKDESGNCTNGILRYQNATLTNHSLNDGLKSTIQNWNPTKYLNIWVVDVIANNVGGYANYASGLTGPNDPNDGLVAVDHYFGDMGTSGGGLYGYGRTSTHEIGHWLGLNHTFAGCDNGDCVNNGDRVCDTPPASSATYQCTQNNQCGGAVQIENYLDYTPDLCMDRFTQGQADRMLAQMNTYRPVLLDSMNAINAGLNGCPTAIKDSEIDNTVRVYPNPSEDIINIELKNQRTSYSWSLTDLSGKIIKKGYSDRNSEPIQIKELKAGQYILQLNFESGDIISKNIYKH